jgi:putative transmembrane protein PGPGW
VRRAAAGAAKYAAAKKPLSVLARLRSAWRTWDEAPAGQRFQSRFERRRRAPRRRLRRAGALAAALLIVLVGVIALPLPGPGLLVIGFGLLLIAEESRTAARALDALEVKLRRLFASGRPRPQRRGIL